MVDDWICVMVVDWFEFVVDVMWFMLLVCLQGYVSAWLEYIFIFVDQVGQEFWMKKLLLLLWMIMQVDEVMLWLWWVDKDIGQIFWVWVNCEVWKWIIWYYGISWVMVYWWFEYGLVVIVWKFNGRIVLCKWLMEFVIGQMV